MAVVEEKQTVPLDLDGDDDSIDRKVPETWATLKLRESVQGHHSGEIFFLRGQEVSVGRSRKCAVLIKFSGHISSVHCIITRPESNSCCSILKDMSTNGTFVNNGVVGKNNETELNDGDVICILHDKNLKDVCSFVFNYTLPRVKITDEIDAVASSVSGVQEGEVEAFARPADKYKKLKILSSGSFGTVHAGEVCNTREEVAIKVIDKNSVKCKSQTAYENIQREVAVHKELHHPNIIKIIDWFEDDSELSIILELAKGGDLLKFISERQKPLTDEAARSIFAQVVGALDYLHNRGIIHRDLKPDNLLLNEDHTIVKLSDFGTSKMIDPHGVTGTLCGTIGYMAPEVWSNAPYSMEVDIWSLGCILFFMLTRCPFFRDFQGLPNEIGSYSPKTLIPDLKLTASAKDLILRLIVINPSLRLTLDQIRQHPWYCGEDVMPDPLPEWLAQNSRMIEDDEKERFSQPHVVCTASVEGSTGEKTTQQIDETILVEEQHVAKPSHERPLCKYGALCYRKNPDHLLKYRHPHDTSY